MSRSIVGGWNNIGGIKGDLAKIGILIGEVIKKAN